MDNVLVSIWIISLVVALSLDVSAYIVLRREWEKRGVLVTDELAKRVSDRLDQIRKTWQKPATPKTEPAPPVQKPVEVVEAAVEVAKEVPSVRVASPEPEPEPIPAPVRAAGQLKHVEFSMDVPLDSAIDISIAATPQGVKVEKRQVK
jgi:hypothetical protein